MLDFYKYISLFFLISYGNIQGQNEIEQYNINGKIKSIGTFSYNFQSGNTAVFFKNSLVDLELFGKNKIIEFDEKGFIQKVTHFSTRNHIRQGIFIYDENYIKKAEVYGDFMKLFKYDKKKNVRKEIWCYSKDCKTKYINDYFGKRLMIRKYKTRGSITEKTIYSYAENHNKPTKEVLYRNYRKNNSEKKFTYNKNKQITSRIKYNNKMRIEENIRFRYDVKGRLSEKISFFRIFSPNHHGSIYSYNTKNEIIKEVHYELDTKQQPLKGGSFVRNYEYKYDSKGNWILCNVYQDQIPKYTIERKISYYE